MPVVVVADVIVNADVVNEAIDVGVDVDVTVVVFDVVVVIVVLVFVILVLEFFDRLTLSSFVHSEGVSIIVVCFSEGVVVTEASLTNDSSNTFAAKLIKSNKVL